MRGGGAGNVIESIYNMSTSTSMTNNGFKLQSEFAKVVSKPFKIFLEQIKTVH